MPAVAFPALEARVALMWLASGKLHKSASWLQARRNGLRGAVTQGLGAEAPPCQHLMHSAQQLANNSLRLLAALRLVVAPPRSLAPLEGGSGCSNSLRGRAWHMARLARRAACTKPLNTQAFL
eukprot:1781098-Rhodomonas_salina.1